MNGLDELGHADEVGIIAGGFEPEDLGDLFRFGVQLVVIDVKACQRAHLVRIAEVLGELGC